MSWMCSMVLSNLLGNNTHFWLTSPNNWMFAMHFRYLIYSIDSPLGFNEIHLNNNFFWTDFDHHGVNIFLCHPNNLPVLPHWNVQCFNSNSLVYAGYRCAIINYLLQQFIDKWSSINLFLHEWKQHSLFTHFRTQFHCLFVGQKNSTNCAWYGESLPPSRFDPIGKYIRFKTHHSFIISNILLCYSMNSWWSWLNRLGFAIQSLAADSLHLVGL